MVASDDRLLGRARTDPDAFELFYRRHVEAMIRFAARRTASAHEVADLVADIFVAVIESVDRFDARRGSAVAWLYGIANNVAADRWRADRRQGAAASRVAGRRLLDDDDIARLEARIDAEQHRRDLLDALRALPSPQRDVLILVDIDGLEPAEAARALGIRPPNARMRLTRGRRRLRARIATEQAATRRDASALPAAQGRADR